MSIDDIKPAGRIQSGVVAVLMSAFGTPSLVFYPIQNTRHIPEFIYSGIVRVHLAQAIKNEDMVKKVLKKYPDLKSELHYELNTDNPYFVDPLDSLIEFKENNIDYY